MKRVLFFGLIFSLNAMAVVLPPVPTEPIYFEPSTLDVPDEVKAMNCVQLDSSIRYLHPSTYTYKEKFHYDKANQVATSLVTTDFIPILGEWFGIAYLGYSALVEEKESRRILNVKQKVAMLQQLKAEKHCFE